MKISNDTVRAVCDEEGKQADQWIGKQPQSVKALAALPGECEFSSDGMSANTTEG